MSDFDQVTARIAFVGAGNMARSLIGGLLARGYPAEQISCSDPFAESLQLAAALGPIRTASDNNAVLADADVVVLAVKPQVMEQVLSPLHAVLQQRQPLLVSIAAGITIESMVRWSGVTLPIVRCMPNTPALLQCGASGVYASAQVSEAQRQLVGRVLEAVGIVAWVDSEAQLDAVTALSGSGPAYFFLLMEAMQAYGEQLGLPAQASAALTRQTALGAARMALESDVDVAELRRRVTSPNGTTQAALENFAANGFTQSVESALQAAYDRSIELADELK